VAFFADPRPVQLASPSIPGHRLGHAGVEADARDEAEDVLRALPGERQALGEEVHAPAVQGRPAPGGARRQLDERGQLANGRERQPQPLRSRATELAGDDLGHLRSRQDFRTSEHEEPAHCLRHRRRQAKAVEEIVDIDRLMLIGAIADHHEDATLDRLEELQEPAIAGAVGLRDTYRDGRETPVGAQHQTFRLELGDPVDVVRLDRRIFIE
jgi:hypothetical protein